MPKVFGDTHRSSLNAPCINSNIYFLRFLPDEWTVHSLYIPNSKGPATVVPLRVDSNIAIDKLSIGDLVVYGLNNTYDPQLALAQKGLNSYTTDLLRTHGSVTCCSMFKTPVAYQSRFEPSGLQWSDATEVSAQTGLGIGFTVLCVAVFYYCIQRIQKV